MRWKTKLSVAHIFIVFVLLAFYTVSSNAHTRDFIRDVKEQSIEFLDEWNISGSNTARLEYYNNRGNQAASIFPHDGVQGLDEFAVNFNKKISVFERYTGQILGVFSGSEYRSQTEHGFILERFNLTKEKGDANIPYRWEAGDHGAFFSFRTLQRTLKGGLLELQPNWGGKRQNHSIIFLTGANQQTWTGLDVFDDYYTGGSWLVEDQSWGRYSLNVVHNVREKNDSTFIDRRQWVTSLAGEKTFGFRGQTLTVESEFGYLEGDTTNGKNQNDNSILVQVSGKNKTPLTYRLRFEHTGQDYLPSGSVTPVNRRSYEAHFGYRTQSGHNIRARLQSFHDAFESANRSDTHVIGANVTGQFLSDWIDNLTGRIDGFITTTKDNDQLVNNTVNTIRIDLAKPLPWNWNGRLSIFHQYVNNEIPGSGDFRTKQISFQADHAVNIGPFTGSATIGLIRRHIYAGGRNDYEWTPSLSGSLSNGNHRVSINYSMDDFNRRAAAELNNKRLNMAYTYSRTPHTFGLEYEKFHRDPSEIAGFGANENTNAYKVAAFWTYTFDRPARTGLGSVARLNTENLNNVFNVLAFGPDVLMPDATATLTRQFGNPNKQPPNIFVFEGPVFSEFDQRQRLVLVETAGVITKSAHIIDIEDIGNLENLEQTYNRIRDKLVALFGPTSDLLERGDFTAAIAQDLDNGDFVRNMQWRTDKGTIRFGIPHRLDGVIRIEIQHGRRFPALNESFNWTIEEVRS